MSVEGAPRGKLSLQDKVVAIAVGKAVVEYLTLRLVAGLVVVYVAATPPGMGGVP